MYLDDVIAFVQVNLTYSRHQQEKEPEADPYYLENLATFVKTGKINSNKAQDAQNSKATAKV